MKNLIIFSFFFLIIFAASAKVTKKNTGKKLVSVELELESIPNVVLYEIEVKKLSDKNSKTLNYTEKSPQFYLKLEVGNYQVRTRAVSVTDEKSEWSQWQELLAPPEEVRTMEVQKYNWAINKKEKSVTVPLAWQAGNGAISYMVFIEDVKSGKKQEYSSKDTIHKARLDAGEYKVGIQSISKDGLKSKITYFKENFFIARAYLPKIDLKNENDKVFSWKQLDDSEVKIDIYRKPFFGTDYEKIESRIIKENSWTIGEKMPPGNYKIAFQYVSEKMESGPIENLEFVKKPNKNNFEKIGN